MNLQQLESMAAELGAEVSYEDANVAFCFKLKKSSRWYVCINDHLSAPEKWYLLAHELAHIACGHTGNALFDPPNWDQEEEANWYAMIYMLAP